MTALQETRVVEVQVDLGDCRALASARVSPQRDGSAYVSNVLVAWWCRGRGVGSTLMRRIAAEADVEDVPLVLDCKLRLVGFYEQFGFEVVGTEDGWITMQRWPRKGGEAELS